MQQLPPSMQDNDYISVDDYVHTEEATDDIMAFIPSNNDNEDKGSDDEEVETPDSESLITTYSEAVASLSHLTKFALSEGATEAIE